MNKTLSVLTLIAALFVLPEAENARAQATQTALPARPVPYPVLTPPAFDRAVQAGTRTRSGEPGPNYWTNTAEYRLAATLSPETGRLRGEGTAVYHNASPDPLHVVYVHLRQNLHQEGAVRNRAQQITGGVHLSSVAYEGQPLVERRAAPGFRVSGTVVRIDLPAPIPPGGSGTFSFGWSFEVPRAGAPRMGQDGEVFYLGYWYPQFAVYDDVHGWVAEPYQGNGEFYMGYADYDVTVTVPDGWLVAATGVLQNAEQVLSARTRERLARAAATEEVVSIVGRDERGAGEATTASETGTHRWHFTAENVRDFAFGASAQYVWDATSASVGDRDGDGAADAALIHALYRPGTPAWEDAARFGQFSIEYLSDYLMPYPYPHMTAVEGIIGGGMEYPMITLIGGTRTERSLFGVTFHEIAHMWFPMVVGQNEKAFTWMDEGLTSYNTNEGEAAFFGTDAWAPGAQAYYRLAGSGDEVESMRHGDEYPYGTIARGIASYSKPAVAFRALEGVLGTERFREAYRTYARRWAYRHPYPYDLFNTFEDVAGEELDWFWTPLFFETWTLDHAVAGVESSRSGVTVTVADEGLTPLPAPVRVTYADGTVAEQTVPVEHWLGGAREATLRFEPGRVEKVEIDPEAYLPDVDRTDNVWQRSAAQTPSGPAGS